MWTHGVHGTRGAHGVHGDPCGHGDPWGSMGTYGFAVWDLFVRVYGFAVRDSRGTSVPHDLYGIYGDLWFCGLGFMGLLSMGLRCRAHGVMVSFLLF